MEEENTRKRDGKQIRRGKREGTGDQQEQEHQESVQGDVAQE